MVEAEERRWLRLGVWKALGGKRFGNLIVRTLNFYKSLSSTSMSSSDGDESRAVPA